MMRLSLKDAAGMKSHALKVLKAPDSPLFAVLDAARTGAVLKFLKHSEEQHQSLYEGPEAERLSTVAPYLISLPAGRTSLERLVHLGWGRNWGIYLTCRLPFKELRRHLRRFLLVESEETREQLYFRFYDPRVLRIFLPTCTPRQREEFFGEIECFWLESREGEVVSLPRAMRQS